ncbi:MAG: hypothetical protein H6R16_3835, partial [Proteobacteria bacterium]|nr:hypothetical protein [Pseudomonadota bacterium]
MPETHRSQIFLGRQPILGREQQLLAYELLFREGPIFTSNRAEITDPAQATATVIANAFTELSANETLGPYRGYINVDQEFLFNDLIEALPPKVVVLEILETVAPTPEVVARCQHLRDKGFSLAIDDVVKIDEAYRPLLELLQLLIYTNPKGNGQGDNPLLPLAATRGRLMELLAEKLVPRNREFSDQAFMVGIMSLMPALLGVQMEEILTHLPVAPRVRQALTEQTGQLGHLLLLAQATEQTDPDVFAEAVQRVPGISLEFLDECLAQALY